MKKLINEGRVLIDFYADWCSPCKMLKPTLEKFSEEQEDVKVIMINVDEHPDFASDFNVRSIPTLIYFEDGEIINKGGGNHSLEGLYSLTKKAE